MSETERLYYNDCYLREFDARLAHVEPEAQGFRVYLNRTAFYPDSGGQPTDRGTLAGIPVLEVVDEGAAIAHLLERAPEDETVRGEIDWRRRFDHMQQHTGQHVLSAAFEKTGSYKTVSFHLGSEVSSIDLDSDRVGRRQIEDAENLANQVVFENRPVRIFFQPAAAASQMDLRKPTYREGDVRLVEVEDFDLSACGGTHVSRSGSVGLIAVRKFERLKGMTRVEFVSGGRTLEAARRDYQALDESARLFSAPLEKVPDMIRKQSEEFRNSERARAKLVERLAESMAVDLWRAAKENAGKRILRQIFPAEDSMLAKMLAHAAAKQPAAVALLAVKGKPTSLFFSQSTGGSLNMGAILKETVTQLGGKGGGARDFAQGGGIDESRLEEALNCAEKLVG